MALFSFRKLDLAGKPYTTLFKLARKWGEHLSTFSTTVIDIVKVGCCV